MHIISTLLFLGLWTFTSAQSPCDTLKNKELSERAFEHSKKIKDHVLAVRLQSHRRKLEKLEELILSPNVSAEKKVKLQEQKDLVEEEGSYYAKSVIKAFKKYYTFSKVVFYWDKDQGKIGNSKAMIWLDEELNKSSSADKPDHIAAFLCEGITVETGLPAFVLKDSNLVNVCRPMPQYLKKNRISTSFKDKKSGISLSTQKMAQELNRELYYVLENYEGSDDLTFGEKIKAWFRKVFSGN